MAAVLGLHAWPSVRTQRLVAEALAGRTWLVLDNREHLLEACTELITELLQACPALRVVATSRQPPAGRRYPLVGLGALSGAVLCCPQTGRMRFSEPNAVQLVVTMAHIGPPMWRRGLSNRGNAEALVISEATAEVHVKHILGNLRFQSRSQAAVWAAGHGLAGDRPSVAEVK